jgi:hypothetical protein
MEIYTLQVTASLSRPLQVPQKRLVIPFVDGEWAQATDASKNREAVMHVVPAAPSLDAFVSQLAIE